MPSPIHLSALVLLLQMALMALIISCTPLQVFHTLPYNFTLAAVNVTLPNANLTGAPLVLGQNGATAGMTFHVTSTYFSYPYNDYPTLALINGNLRAFTTTGEWITNASSPSNYGNSLLEWVTSRSLSSPADLSFSAVHLPGISWYPVLAVYGVADSWSLCPPEDGGSMGRGQTNVVFNRTVGGSDRREEEEEALRSFNPALCFPVFLHILPVA